MGSRARSCTGRASAALEAGAETLVIVADPEYHAIGLYRSAGFDDRETKVELTRRPPASPSGGA